jgi:hypothetical protein
MGGSHERIRQNRRRRLCLGALLLLSGAATPETARGQSAFSLNGSARVFTAAGAPTSARGSTAAGAVATSAVLGSIERLAAAPDGGFVFITFQDDVLRVDAAGRLTRLLAGRREGYGGDGGPSARARVGSLTDVAVGADGSVYVADDGNCNVRRLAPDGRMSTVVGQRRRAFPGLCRDRGDGGSGRLAELCGVQSLTTTSRHSLLMATRCGAVRELGADGVVRRVAGGRRRGSAQDGQRALDAPLAGEGMRLAAMAGGETVIVEGYTGARVWLVDGEGRLRRIREAPRSPNIEVLGLPDGGLLLAPESSGRLLRRWPDGRLEHLLAGRWNSAVAGIHDGDGGALSAAPLSPVDMAVAADGGLLLLESDNVRYIAPPEPRRLAVGIARETLSSRLPLELTVEATMPTRATVDLRVRGRLIERLEVDLPFGRSTLPLRNGTPGELNVVGVNAVATVAGGPEQVASDRLGVIPGNKLPMRVVKRVERDEADLLESVGGGRNRFRCRRFAPQRIDCAQVDSGTCQAAHAYFLRRDGVLTSRRYADRHRCRLRARPIWKTRPRAVTLPT